MTKEEQAAHFLERNAIDVPPPPPSESTSPPAESPVIEAPGEPSPPPASEERPTFFGERFDECPDPPYKNYANDDPNPHARTVHLWKFWNELPERFKSLITGYVYRTYPPLIDPGEDSKEYKYIDVVNAPFKSDRDFNDRYGAGDFKIFLNIQDKKRRTLAIGQIKGNRDFKAMPPADRRITELDEKGRPRWIDIHDPQCKTYVEFLRTRGLIPEQWEAKREAEMEQQADVLKTVLGMQRELIDKATKPREDNSRPMEETVGRVIDTAMQGAKAGQEILKDTIKTLQDQLNRPSNAQSSTESLQIALQIAEMISKQSDPKPYMQIISELNKTVSGLQMDRLNDKIEQLRATQNPPAGPSQNLSNLIEEFRKIQDLVGGGDERGPRLPGWLQAAQYLADPVARIVGNLTTAFMASRMPPGAMGGIPMPPVSQPPPSAPPTGPMSNVSPEAFAQPALAPQPYRDPRLYPHLAQEQAPPPPQSPYSPQSQSQPQAYPGAQDPDLVLLVAITPAFLNQLRDGLGGDDLADWLIGGFGEGPYNRLIERCKSSGMPADKAMLMFLDSYPPIAPELQRENRADVERFVKQFCEFDGDAYDRKRGRESSAAEATV